MRQTRKNHLDGLALGPHVARVETGGPEPIVARCGTCRSNLTEAVVPTQRSIKSRWILPESLNGVDQRDGSCGQDSVWQSLLAFTESKRLTKSEHSST